MMEGKGPQIGYPQQTICKVEAFGFIKGNKYEYTFTQNGYITIDNGDGVLHSFDMFLFCDYFEYCKWRKEDRK